MIHNNVESVFRCYSCRVDDATFNWIKPDVHMIRVEVLSDKEIKIITKLEDFQSETDSDAVYKAHRLLVLWLACLNIGSFNLIGHNQNDHGLQHFKTIEGKKLLFEVDGSISDSNKYLTSDQAKLGSFVYIPMAYEKRQDLLDEYIQGLFHMTTSFHGINFYRSAFANFYRIFEYFVVNRVLNMTKLGSNEVKAITEALRIIDAPEPIITIFREEIYRTRSSQVMHAWQDQMPIEPELTGKMKVLCDFTIFKCYEPE